MGKNSYFADFAISTINDIYGEGAYFYSLYQKSLGKYKTHLWWINKM